MKFSTLMKPILAAALVSAAPLFGGDAAQISAKSSGPVVADVEPYEANRGLLTITGPTGLFINPTSATLPQNAFTVQYCLLLPDFDFQGTIAHGALAAYGITDWLEVGALFLAVTDVPGDGTDMIGGPYARLRLLKHDGWIPQVSVGGYGKFGDSAIRESGAFLAATERWELNNAGPFKSIALHTGIRQAWTKEIDSFRGYWGVDLQLPYRLYIVGEIATKAKGETDTPWAAGLQWRAGGINISTAAVDVGAGKTGFFFGIGSQF